MKFIKKVLDILSDIFKKASNILKKALCIFKKKPQIEANNNIEPPKSDLPEVIKESKIKPTTCKYCLSVYQAKHKHIKGEQSIEYLRPRFHLLAQCPICKNFNEVEFEEAGE